MNASLKQMNLYRDVERIERALDAAGLSGSGALAPTDLEALDQLHYEGHDAVDHAVRVLGIEPGAEVLDVGSGLGGPARWLADRHGLRVTALELQPDLHECAVRLTERCGLDDRIVHLQGDILAQDAVGKRHDALVSWLVFLHIPDRERLLKRCRALLRPRGGLYIEDFYVRQTLSDRDRELLREDVACTHLVDEARYRQELLAAGFGEPVFIDRTDAWHRFVVERERAFIDARQGFVETHGADSYEAMLHFYRSIRELFAGGRLGGARITARVIHE
jgi:2-polyprenyl-3-methyl-5-hydroxy-6-metoxy-1,4-benzoquinol methylase